jgi:hypothetical protein
MKTLKERLEEKISYEAGLNTVVYGPSYKAGAVSLVALVVELHSALEQYSDGDNTPVATEALQSIEKFIGEK